MKHAERAMWLALGVSAGAAFTYLFATNDGKQLRKKVSKGIGETRDRIVATASDIHDQGKEVVGEIREFVSKKAKSIAK